MSKDESIESPPTKKIKRESISDYDTEDDLEMSCMAVFKSNVHAVFSKVIDRAIGDFAISGQLDNPPIVVIAMKNDSATKIHFPLYEDEAKKIIPFFESSPFGKGSETVMDTSIRNSLQLNPEQFEILNPDWNSYVNDVLVSRIAKEMCIRTSFTASLYKCLLYETGSFFKSHRDSEKVDGMFATLVIQLPSKYAGGQLIVKHDGKEKMFDFSSSESDSKAFRTCFSAFYCDCEQELQPITAGLRLCLVYNLISEETETIPIAPVDGVLEKELKELFNDWPVRQKLVYALKHKYSERSHSLENLKTSDKAVANILKSLSDVCELDIYLAVFEKYIDGQGDGRGSNKSDDFDTDDDSCMENLKYNLNSLIPLSACSALSGLSLENVNFDDEVFPEECFAKMKPESKHCQPTGNEGVHVSKSYRTAAIVFWPRRFTLEVLKDSNVPRLGYIKYFLEEVQKHKGSINDKNIRQRLIEFAQSALMSNFGIIYEVKSNLVIPVLSALITTKDIKLLQKFLEQDVMLNETVLRLMKAHCDELGWKNFENQWISMFKKVNNLDLEQSLYLFSQLIEGELEKDMNDVCCKIVETIFISLEEDTRRNKFSTAEQEKVLKLKNDPEFLCLLCIAAQKLNYDLIEFLKNKNVTVAVQVLIKLANSTGRLVTFKHQFAAIAEHLVAELEDHIATKNTILLWGRQITPQCGCRDCAILYAFLEGNDQSINFNVSKTRRSHLQIKMKNIQDLSHAEDESGKLTITKTRPTGQDLIDACDASKKLLEKLREVL